MSFFKKLTDKIDDLLDSKDKEQEQSHGQGKHDKPITN